MIKKIIIAATFVGSLTVGVPSASANPGMCYHTYNMQIRACGGSQGCERSAEIALANCLEQLVIIHQ